VLGKGQRRTPVSRNQRLTVLSKPHRHMLASRLMLVENPTAASITVQDVTRSDKKLLIERGIPEF
jgi:hypothetical protein